MGLPKISEEAPWKLADIFKAMHSGALAWFDCKIGVWTEGERDRAGSSTLGEYVTDMIQEALSDYCFYDGEWSRQERRDFGNRSFREGVASCVLPEIIQTEGFSLDPDSSRRYLNFGKQCWDRETDAWVETKPEFRALPPPVG